MIPVVKINNMTDDVLLYEKTLPNFRYSPRQSLFTFEIPVMEKPGVYRGVLQFFDSETRKAIVSDIPFQWIVA